MIGPRLDTLGYNRKLGIEIFKRMYVTFDRRFLGLFIIFPLSMFLVSSFLVRKIPFYLLVFLFFLFPQ